MYLRLFFYLLVPFDIKVWIKINIDIILQISKICELLLALIFYFIHVHISFTDIHYQGYFLIFQFLINKFKFFSQNISRAHFIINKSFIFFICFWKMILIVYRFKHLWCREIKDGSDEKEKEKEREKRNPRGTRWGRKTGETTRPEVVSSGSPVDLTCWTTLWPEVHCTATGLVTMPLPSLSFLILVSILFLRCGEENNKGFLFCIAASYHHVVYLITRPRFY